MAFPASHELENVKRVSFAEQINSLREIPSAGFKHVNYVEGLNVQAQEGKLEDESSMTSKMIKKPSRRGSRTYQIDFKTPLFDNAVSIWDRAFTSCLGAKIAASELVWDSSNGVEDFTVTSGKIAPIVKYIDNNGNVGVRPVKAINGGTNGIWAIQPDVDTSVDNVLNPSDTGENGAIYRSVPRAEAITFEFETDGHNEPDQDNVIGLGCVPSKLMINITPEATTFLDWSFTGVDYNNGTGANIENPGDVSGYQYGGICELYIQDLTTPAIGNEASHIEFSSIEFDLAPLWKMAKGGTRPLLGASNNPGSPVTGWERDMFFSNPIKITTLLKKHPVTSTLWRTYYENKTPLQIFIVLRMGNPGDPISTKFAAFWFQECVIDTKPVNTVVDGMVGQSLEFKVREAGLDPDNDLDSQVHFALFV